MKIKCEKCNAKFEFDDTYGLCPKCNYYNNGTDTTPDLDVVDNTNFEPPKITKLPRTNETNEPKESKTTHQKVSNFIRVISILYFIFAAYNIFLPAFSNNNHYQQDAPTYQAPLIDSYVETDATPEKLPEPEPVPEIDFAEQEEAFAKCELPINLEIDGTVVTGYTTTPNLICSTALIDYGVTEIADYAFEGCDDLEVLILSETVERIGKHAFANLPNLKYIYLFSNSLKVIDDYAFFGVSAEEIYLTPTVEYIGDYAMYNMNVVDQLPATTTLGIRAIKHEFDKNLLENDMQITNGVLVTYVGSETHVDIPEGVTQIYTLAFAESNVQTITLPESLEYIGIGAFYNSSLTEITFPEQLTFIDDYAFEGSKKLEKVDFTSSPNIYNIGQSAFANCINLSDMTFPKSVTSVSLDSFSKTLWEEQRRPDGDWIINSVLMEITSKTTDTLTLPDGVNFIASYGINGHMKTPKEIVFPDGVLSISKYAINIPNQVPVTLTIPSSVKVIADDLIPYSEIDYEMITIKCEEGSYAQSYAVRNDIYYVLY